MGFADIKDQPFTPKGGNHGHGYDPMRAPEMKAFFLAAGPDIQQSITVPSFENVNVYPLIAYLLGLDTTHLKTGAIEGDLKTLRPWLTEH